MRVTQVADNPSVRVMALVPDSKRSVDALGDNDKIIFGTGDQHKWQTVTTDKRFYDAARFRGVELDVKYFDPGQYSGN